MGTGRRSGCGYSGCLLLTVGLCAFATVWVKFSFSFFSFFFWLHLCWISTWDEVGVCGDWRFGWIFEFGWLW